MKYKKTLALVTAAILGFTLCACGGFAQGSSAADNSQPQSDSTSEQESGDSDNTAGNQESGEEKIVTIAYDQTWNSLNPYSSTGVMGDTVCNQIFDNLIAQGMSGSVYPRLAEKWEVSDDNLSITFYLNGNAKWHDGEPVTADDVVFTCKLITKGEIVTSRRQLMQNVAGTDDSGVELSADSVEVEKIDDLTVKMNMKKPMSGSMFLKQASFFFVLPEHLLKDVTPAEFMESDFWNNPVGNGPFRYESTVPGERVVYTVNKDYYMGEIGFDKLVIRSIASANLLSSLMSGEVDLIPGSRVSFPIADVPMAESQDNLVVESLQSPGHVWLIVDNEKFDVKTRQAFDMAINREEMVKELVGGKGTVREGMYASNNLYYDPAISQVSFSNKYDPENAKKILEENNFDFSQELLILTVTGDSLREQTATLFQRDMANIGVTVNVQSVDLSTMMQMMRDKEADFGIMKTSSDGANPLENQDFFTIGGMYNLSHVTDSTGQELFSKIMTALTDEEIKEYASELQLWHAEAECYYFLYSPDITVIYNNRLSNMKTEDMSMSVFDYWNWKVD